MKNYIIGVILAAVICAFCENLLSKNTASGKIVRLLCGIFMAVTVISPLGNITFHHVSNYFDSLTLDANTYVTEGSITAQKEVAGIIKTQVEAYILDKAKGMDLDISVEVDTDGSNDSLPSGVTVTGKLSPYARGVLSAYIEDELGITVENQQWN